jgi:hypothetical protein
MPDNEGGWQDVQQDQGWQDVPGPDAIAKQSKSAAIAAGVQNPGVSTPPLKPAMEAAGARHEANEAKLGEAEHRAMQSPTPVTNATSILAPAAELPSLIGEGGIKAIGRGALRLAGKSVAGAGVGAGVGGIAGGKRGAEIGAGVGAAVAPMTPDSWFSGAPYGLNRAILGEEGLAHAKAASKLAQRNADIAAGLRNVSAPKPATPGPVGTSTAPKSVAALPPMDFPKPWGLNDIGPNGEIPDQLTDLAQRTPRGAAIAKGVNEGSITTTGNAQPTFLREIPRRVPNIAGPEGEGPIGSNPNERRIQTTASKAIVTPEEYNQSVRDLGSRARMLPGEGEAEWRARVTGLLKAARPRTN